MPNLVGIGLSQVPTNSMLGGLAYQSPDHASIKDLDLKNLSQINSEIADTAVDIFVYDTSKDSDGGAWRKRTSHTSWYNETLNTSTRGSRREFPAVAVIVAEATQLTIYDGDDPDLPMWMVFNLSGVIGSSSNMLPRGGSGSESDITSVAFLNAKLVVGLKDISGSVGEGPVEINFISDFGRVYREVGSGYTGAIYDLPISGRNSSGTYRGDYNSLGIIQQTVNDVAMTVLPNAPIDETTGLPIPTIAVATDGGVSVIKDDGTVVDIYRTSDDNVYHVSLDGDRVIMYMALGAIYVATIPSADQSGNPNAAWSVYGSFSNNTSGVNYPAIQALGSGADLVSMKDHTFAIAGYNSNSNNDHRGLSILSEDVNSSGNGMVAWAHTDFNTGWMHGNIKGAFLSDTDATNITAGNLVTNGTFDSNITNWSSNNGATLSHQNNGNPGGNINVYSATGSNGYALQIITTEVGKFYTLQFDHYHVDGSAGYVNIGNSLGGGQVLYTGPLSTSQSWTTYTYVFKAEVTSTYIGFYSRPGGNVRYDNISVGLAEADRSVNANGLQVFGAITKSAVATGAELVAYSGFSNSNYLVQPYNSDMQTGTGAFSVTAWFKTTSTEENFEGLIYYNRSGSIGDGWQIMLEPNSDGKGLYFYTYGASANITTSSVDGLNDGVWHQVVVTHNNGSIQLFVDGTLRKSSSNPSAGSINDSQAKLHIGRWYGNANSSNYWWRGSIALARHSASVPSAAQIKKIYEDEKVLFQENAACTLYGSSDAVTALAYDEVTEQLHVGTSSGRSDFQGLRRINNTTTAVTTAISAHDEFIVEQ